MFLILIRKSDEMNWGTTLATLFNNLEENWTSYERLVENGSCINCVESKSYRYPRAVKKFSDAIKPPNAIFY